ncbi:hypothetical protein BDN72DRAFT_781548, partial [Pluteus cervinus]
MPKAHIPAYLEDHNCSLCIDNYTIFKVDIPEGVHNPIKYPPAPLKQELVDRIISDFCEDISPAKLEESGCAVCGELHSTHEMQPLKNFSGYLEILEIEGIAKQERLDESDPIQDLMGPVIALDCKNICTTCRTSLYSGKIPKYALANGLWIGEIPSVLQNLTFIEKLLVSRVRLNCCFVRVASGFRKMISHVIAFESPMPKIYDKLPPSLEDLDEVLAILFTGPACPTQKEFARTPLLVRRNHVMNALNWLKLNHCDYADIEISEENMDEYPEDLPPVTIQYKQMDSNKISETMNLIDYEEEDGVNTGDCPFVVHGLS